MENKYEVVSTPQKRDDYWVNVFMDDKLGPRIEIWDDRERGYLMKFNAEEYSLKDAIKMFIDYRIQDSKESKYPLGFTDLRIYGYEGEYRWAYNSGEGISFINDKEKRKIEDAIKNLG